MVWLGDSIDAITNCYNKDTSSDTISQYEDSNTTVKADQLGPSSDWDTYMAYLGDAIDVVCMAKDTVVDFFNGAERRFKRKQRRLFAKGKIKRMKKYWGESWVDATLDFFAEAAKEISAAAKDIKAGITDGLDWVKTTADEISAWVNKKLKAIFKPVGDFFHGIKEKT